MPWLRPLSFSTRTSIYAHLGRTLHSDEYIFGTALNAFLKSCAPLLWRGQAALAVADGRNSVRPEQLQYGTGGPSERENLYTRELLEQAFAGLEIIRLAEHDSEVDEGPRHSGISALIDLVARKPA